jgi:hypothetical protein
VPTDKPQEPPILPVPTLTERPGTTTDALLPSAHTPDKVVVRKKRKKKPPLLVPVKLDGEQYGVTLRFTLVDGEISTDTFVQLKISWARRLTTPPYPDAVPPNVMIVSEGSSEVHRPTMRWSKKLRWIAAPLKFTVVFESEKYEVDIPDPKAMKKDRKKTWRAIAAERERLKQVEADQAKPPPKKGEV